MLACLLGCLYQPSNDKAVDVHKEEILHPELDGRTNHSSERNFGVKECVPHNVARTVSPL
jgi:hypothetical protein